MAEVKIRALEKNYAGVPAVRGVDLDIADGEFTVLVGPSGCGKSTLLRSIAGLEDINSGTIEIGGEVVNEMRPRDRDVAMVFQDYALYPHMTVEGNISLSLRARNTPKREIEERVRRAAGMLGIGMLLKRYPRQLSGGQRQRVAIGRAIVRNPRVFLFDEPLSNLDAQLRDEMRGELKRLHREISTTMIYVTHDQIEAMTLADRIVLMREGRIEQQGSPLELFEQPATLFVAGFLGSPKMTFLKGRLERHGDTAFVILGAAGSDVAVQLPLPTGRLSTAANDRAEVILGIRPEHASRATGERPASGSVRVNAVIDFIQPTGSRSYATFDLGGQAMLAELQAHDVSQPGETIAIDINLNRASLFDPMSGKAI
ncbi:MAG TPA: sn-glycerol-3-phosphate ABC transporter ATP-binding protein UgpC [Candidatus Binatia bacterium]|nr:sn-glycerol-3-phosphate ABC transporter ATP-binding protein UgpC [Candidatus Binatia bacterium]